MDMSFFEVFGAALMAFFTSVLGVVWNKADKAEKISEQNRIFLEHMDKNIDKTAELTERLTSLEASFSVEIKNLSLNIKRLESAVLRLYQENHPRFHSPDK